MSAAALRCLGGELQAQLVADVGGARSKSTRARDRGPMRVFTTEELAPGEVIVVATRCLQRRSAGGVRFPDRLGANTPPVMCYSLQLGALHRRTSTSVAVSRREEVRLWVLRGLV